MAGFEMPKRPLGKLPFQASAIGLGTWALGGPTFSDGKPTGWGPQQESDSVSTVHRALEKGITFFDTADSYGNGTSERLLARALGSHTKEVLICTKIGNRFRDNDRLHKDFSAQWTIEAVEASLKRLNRDWIDILLLHSPPDDMDWNGFDRTALERLKKSGKIRAYGVSAHSYRGAEKALTQHFGDVIEAIYNLLDRRLADHVLPAAQKCGIGIIARVPLASGFLTGKFDTAPPRFHDQDVRSTLVEEEIQWRRNAVHALSDLKALPGGLTVSALRFCLSHQAVSTIIPGMRNPTQVDMNTLAASLGPLPDPWIQEIERRIPHVYPGWEKQV